MEFITQLKAFDRKASAEGIPPNAYVVYMKLFYLNNDLYWREWFSITYSRLCFAVNIGSEDTIAKAVNILEKKGFIEVKRHGNKKPNEYKIIPLNDLNFRSKNEDKKTNDLNFRSKDRRFLGQKADERPGLNKTKTETKTKTKKAAAATVENANENSNVATLAEDATNENRSLTLAEDKENDEFAATVKVFQENFHSNIGKIEEQELHALFLRYGGKWLTEAVKEATLSGGRSVRYIAAILERWQKDGFKAETKRKGGTMRGENNAGGYKRDIVAPKDEGLDDFDAADRNQSYPWDL